MIATSTRLLARFGLTWFKIRTRWEPVTSAVPGDLDAAVFPCDRRTMASPCRSFVSMPIPEGPGCPSHGWLVVDFVQS